MAGAPLSPHVDVPATRSYPLVPRLLAAALALAGGLYFGAARPGTLVAQGYPFAATALALSIAPFAILFALYALAPSLLESPARRWTRLDLADGAHVGAALLMACTLWITLAYGAFAGGVAAFESQILLGEPARPLSGGNILVGLLFNALVFVVPALMYVAVVRDDTRSPLAALGLRRDGLPRALILGAATAIGVILALLVVGAAMQAMGIVPDENERALEIAQGARLAGSLALGALALAVGTSVTEEIFFRGFLQPRIGLVAQAVIFGLAHLSYLHVVEILVTFTLGLLFGILYLRTRNLWAPIAGHFTFNLVMLLLAQNFPTPTPT